MLKKDSRIYIAGHKGMVGSAIMRALSKQDYPNRITRCHADLDLTQQCAVRDFFEQSEIDVVILAAAKVGGIWANNTYPAEFIYNNLMIQSNVIHAAYVTGVKTLLFLGSSCIYPKYTEQPIQEKALLSGPLEPTNEPYAIAKIAGLKLCESYNRQYGTDYRTLMPCNLYGPEDHFADKNSHVIPALIHKFHQAKLKQLPHVTVWGSGSPRREFLYVDDLAEACLHVLRQPQDTYHQGTQPMCAHLNVGTGKDLTIADLAQHIKEITGYSGSIQFDSNQPDGTLQKKLAIDRIQALNWQPRVSLEEGLQITYAWYQSKVSTD
ncbi:GDP-L-fucose synthase [Zooshikella sp. WH53]|uniref:GDP-L-fucose synthase n=2 Tax=Zooshikella harenae TaxID=2827238 RepID=A0ABS5ZCD9_9GAMM|nr:GDP-L-fucose synthase [Zooshikella harenae]